MADNRVAEAANVVARRILAEFAQDVAWDEYPEFCRYDWETVIARMDEIAGRPSIFEYEAAYEFLAARATTEKLS